MKEIPLSKGQIALIDDEDYQIVSQYKWHYSECVKDKYGYARNNKVGYLHKLIAKLIYGEFDKDKMIDHKNRNKLDNRRENIRLCTCEENVLNSVGNKNKKSHNYKGIIYDKRFDQWEAHFINGNIRKFIGSFENAKDAALAYDIYSKPRRNLDFFIPNFDYISEEDEKRILLLLSKQRRKTKNTSKYKGVYFNKRAQKYFAYIYYAPNKKYNLGQFEDETEAAKAYNKKAIELYGDKAILNNV